jgi:imidazolonepropionase-like amidohydrolase
MLRFCLPLLLLASALRAQPTAIVGARLIDGTGAAPIDDSVILIESGRIRSAGPRAQARIPANATRVEAAGKTVIPGLIDTHCHYAAPLEDVRKHYAALLRWGVTTIRNAGSDSADAVAMFHKFRDGAIPGPRVYTAGLGFTHPQGAPKITARLNRPETEEQARAAVRALAAQKVDFIKIWVSGEPGKTKITPEIRAAIAGEAAKYKIPVLAHITTVEDIRQLVSVGVTDILHTPGNEPATPELVAFAKSKGLSFSPTLANMESSYRYYEHPELLQDPRMRDAFYPRGWERVNDAAAREKALASDLSERKERVRVAARFVKAMRDGGVRVATGTDTGAELSPVPFGAATHREVEILVENGFTPLDAIKAATLDAARVLARSEDPPFGAIRAGKAADLVILDADPTQDIRNLRKIHRVFRAGAAVD